MLIEVLRLINAEKTKDGYRAEIELETADNMEFSGQIEIDHDWNYDLGFLSTFVNTENDKSFVHGILSSEDFKNDVQSYIAS